jgi:hypothetical protein
MLLVRCPAAQHTAQVGVLTENETLAKLRRDAPRFRCPECHQLHGWAEAYTWLAPVALIGAGEHSWWNGAA